MEVCNGHCKFLPFYIYVKHKSNQLLYMYNFEPFN